MSYQPRTGSVAARAIAYLAAVGIPVAARPLADAVDSEPDVLATSLVFALDEGMVVREKRDGLNWYRLGNPPAETEPTARRVVPVEPKAPPPVAEPPPAPPQPAAPIPPARDSQHVLKAEAARPDATDRENPANASPVGGPMGARQPAAAGPPAPLPRVRAGVAAEPPTLIGKRAAIYTTGELGLESECGRVMVFTKERASTLVKFFARFKDGEGREA